MLLSQIARLSELTGCWINNSNYACRNILGASVNSFTKLMNAKHNRSVLLILAWHCSCVSSFSPSTSSSPSASCPPSTSCSPSKLISSSTFGPPWLLHKTLLHSVNNCTRATRSLNPITSPPP